MRISKQDERMVKAARHLWELSRPTPAQSRVTWCELLRTSYSWVLSISKDGHSTACMLGHPFVKNCGFVNVEMVFLVFPFMLIPSCPFTEYHLESDFIFFSRPIGYSYTCIRSPLSLLQAEQSQLSQPLLICQMLQSLNHLHDPLLTCCSKFLSLLYWGAQNWTQHL